MCWTGFKQNHKIADEDVKVIKVLYRKISKGKKILYYAPLTLFKYKLNKEYKDYILIPHRRPGFYNDISIEINRGLHTFSTKCKPVYRHENNDKVAWICGYKFYDYKKRLIGYTGVNEDKIINGEFELVFMEAIIPKGTEYYENTDGEIVSNHLIVTDKEYKIWKK